MDPAGGPDVNGKALGGFVPVSMRSCSLDESDRADVDASSNVPECYEEYKQTCV